METARLPEPTQGPAAPPVPQVVRVSTTYVPQQDRLRLAAETSEGDVLVLWLTQRMLRLVLKPLGGFFGQNAPRTRKEQVRQSYVDLMDKVSRKAGTPVRPEADSPGWLVEKVDVATTGAVAELTFWGEGAPRARFEVDTVSLRRWLEVVQRKADKGGWPRQMWDAIPLGQPAP